MTVSTTTRKANYTVQAGVDTYSFNFYTQDVSHIKVLYDDVEQASGFTTTLNADQGASPGGNVVLNPIPAAGTRLTILRDVPETQEVDYIPYDDFPAETHEGALDKLTMITQQNSEQISRAISAPPSDDGTTDFSLPAYDAGKGIMWDPSEKKMKNSQDNFDTLVADATTQANNAATSAGEASTSASNAAASESKANEWAEKPEDQEVEPGQYSALHWAAKAATFNPGDYVKKTGDTMSGNLIIESLAPTMILKDQDSTNVYYLGRDQNNINRGSMQINTATGYVRLNAYSAAGVITGNCILENAGNLSISAAAPTQSYHLTRKDYVDAQIAASTPIKAWCSFDGLLTGTNAPAAGLNVSTVQRLSAGLYRLTFATPMPDANYSVVAMSNVVNCNISARTTTHCDVQTAGASGTASDGNPVMVQIAGN